MEMETHGSCLRDQQRSPEIAREIYIGSVPENVRDAVEGVERLLATRGSLNGPK